MSDVVPFETQMKTMKRSMKMSELIPFEIQIEIIKNVHDVKSLIRFKSVSKEWKSFIDSFEFVTGYGARHTHPRTLLLRYKDIHNNAEKYVSFVDDNDHIFTQQDNFSNPGISVLVKQLKDAVVVGSCHGLWCFFGYDNKCGRYMAVISNPSIRRSVGVVVPNYDPIRTTFGFGVCPLTNDPTIVKISYYWQFEIFTLSSKRWWTIPCRNNLTTATSITSSNVVVDRFIYWVVEERILIENGPFFYDKYMIMSFDLIAKEVKFIDKPRNVTGIRFFISKLRESLVLFSQNVEDKIVYNVWKMEREASFTMLYTIRTPGSSVNNILGFRKNDQPIIITRKENENIDALEDYEPCSDIITNLGIYGEQRSFFMSSYKETLLLHDHPDCCIYSRKPRSWKLAMHPKLSKGKLVAMIVLHGWGEASAHSYNCIHVADTPTMGAPDKWRLVRADGTAAGFPIEDNMGDSEVGHYAQGAILVDQAFASGKIYEHEGFNYIKESFETNTLHLIGLMNDGGVHSRLDQLLLLLRGSSERGARKIRVHVLTDGRDVLDGSSLRFAEILETELSDLRSKGIDARVASGGGCMYVPMDRYENDWEVVKRGWDAAVLGEAPHKFTNFVEAIKKLRESPGSNDQYLPPFVIVDDSGKPVGPIVDGDAVVTVNFHADRMTMLAQALEYENFDKFDRVRAPNIRYAGMLQYDEELNLPNYYLVPPPLIDPASEDYLVHNGVRTFACSETVNIPRVAYFWNGNRLGNIYTELEGYVEISSDSGITFNVQPNMKALEIGKKTRDAILSGKFDQVRVNIPNVDMVRDNVGAPIDEAVKMILDAVEQVGGIYVVTADRGNAEDLVKRNIKDGAVHILTSHTLQPVPVAIGGPGLAAGVRFRKDIPSGELANVEATVMNLHGFVAPDEYGTTLIEVVD